MATTKDEAAIKFEEKYPDWKLVEFTEGNGKCVVQHKCGNIKTYKSFNSVLCVGPHCDACRPKKELIWKYNIGDVIKDNHRDITITDRKIGAINDGGKSVRKKYYKYKCNACGYDCGPSYLNGTFIEERWVIESSLGAGVGCAACRHRAVVTGINDIATITPQRVKFFKNKEDTLIFSPVSHHIVEAVCPLCGRGKNINIDRIDDNGIGCICSDGFSYPEKFIYCFLEQVSDDFVYQLSNTTFQWCGAKRYDFYLPNENVIIEVHGAQHYCDSGFYDNKRRTLSEEIENDNIKKELAFKNGFDENNYIILDCRKSDVDFIKKSIEYSGLIRLLNIQLDNVNWQQCHIFAARNFTKKMCDYWESYKTQYDQVLETKIIATKFHVGKGCVLDNLKKGRELGWCYFLTRLEKSKVVSDTIVELYISGKSVNEIMEILNVDRHKVIDSLKEGTENGKCYYNGKQSLKEANIGLNSPVGTPVYCVELNLMFPTRTEGEKFINRRIGHALDNPQRIAGGYHWRRITKQQYEEWYTFHKKPTFNNPNLQHI